ncbi:MAG: DNA-directed RNA polymerase subunit alpha [Sedimentisphaerales bacterium]|nr:DNA-directed RNA polymerase subunit alpha [Sedimentisphaerales bacterium]
MRIRWRGLELPTKVELDSKMSSDKYGKFSIEPFERGFGTTLGNSLRRILLSSLEGSAVTSIKIKGATHEFASITGVLEDVCDIILNIKTLVVSVDSDLPKTMRIRKNTIGDITAADIEADPSITIYNKDHKIATLTANVDFDLELTVGRGRGYVSPAEKATRPEDLGIIEIDAIYSPVTRVRYRIEETRVGQDINYDRLVMEIWTDGTITPQMALVESAKILRKHLGPFIQYAEVGNKGAFGGEVAVETCCSCETECVETDNEMARTLRMSLNDLDLSVRAMNCLEMGKFETVGQLVAQDENQLMSLRSFGKTSLREVKRKLEDLGLSLGMDVSGYDISPLE